MGKPKNRSHVPKVPFDYIRRADWGALPPRNAKRIRLPVVEVVEDYNTKVDVCYNREECTARVQLLQKYAMAKGYHDINYSFLIGGDGDVYEGRGWLTHLTDTHEWHGYNFAYIGNFSENLVRLSMIEAFEELIEYAIENKYLVPNYKLMEINKVNLLEDEKVIFL